MKSHQKNWKTLQLEQYILLQGFDRSCVRKVASSCWNLIFDFYVFLGSELQDRQPLGTGSRRGFWGIKNTPHASWWPKNPRPQHKATSFHHKDDLSAIISHKMKTWSLYLTKTLRPRQLGSCHQYMDTGQDRRTQASGFWNVPRYNHLVAPVPFPWVKRRFFSGISEALEPWASWKRSKSHSGTVAGRFPSPHGRRSLAIEASCASCTTVIWCDMTYMY